MSPPDNYGFCNICDKRVPASNEVRGNQVYLVKKCPACGENETLISSDASQYFRKRRLGESSLKHESSIGGAAKASGPPCRPEPRMVLLEVTNACNMNCPLCLSNVPDKGFEFQPSLQYFERMFQHFSARHPRPYVELFGGEPTVRDDLFDIIRLGKKHGLNIGVVTNGLRLADEQYCRELLSTGAKIQFQFDGVDPGTYKLLRGSEKFLDKKLAALENIRKHSPGKIALLCTVGKGINDTGLGDMLDFCHERRDFVHTVFFVPLAKTWEDGAVDFEWSEQDRLTREGVEELVSSNFAEPLEFPPACALKIPKVFDRELSVFGGASPDCESATLLISTGERFVSVSEFLKTSLMALVEDLNEEDERGDRFVEWMKQSGTGRLLNGLRLGGFAEKAIFYPRFAFLLLRHVDLGNVTASRGLRKLMKISRLSLSIPAKGKRRSTLGKVTGLGPSLRLYVIPYQDRFRCEGACLEKCQAAMAFIDPDTDTIETTPLCGWGRKREGTLGKIGCASRTSNPSGNRAIES